MVKKEKPAARRNPPAPGRKRSAAQQDYTVEAVARAAVALFAFSPESPELSLAELAEITGSPKPSLFRILWTLCAHDLLVHDRRTNTYSLGYSFVRLAYLRMNQFSIRAKTTPVMERIRDAVNETVTFAVRVGDRRVNVDYVEAAQAIGGMPQRGFEAPLYAGSAGRVILAAMTDEEIERYLRTTPLTAFTRHTMTDPERLRREIAWIRLRGYALSVGELTEAVVGVAAPVYDERGQVFAALLISYPRTRNTRALRYKCIREVLVGAQEISQAMKYS